jgi:hypothetical protein
MANRLPRRLLAPALLLGLCACAGSLNKSEQGLYGTFTVYGPTREKRDCKPMVTQADIDDCRKANEAIIEEPLQGSILIKNLETGQGQKLELDSQGSYRAKVSPGEYIVCAQGDCSDPMQVTLGKFFIYGQRLPREIEKNSLYK